MSLQMNTDHAVELCFVHRKAHRVADEARVVHQDVQIAEFTHGRGHQVFRERPIGNAAHACHGATASGSDRRDHLVGRVR